MAGKRLWGITVNSDGPGEDGGSAPLLATLELAAGYMKMRFGGALVGHGNEPVDVERDAVAMAAARVFFG